MTLNSAALSSFLDRGINLAWPPVEIHDGVGLDIDPGRNGHVLRLDRRRGGAGFAPMGGPSPMITIPGTSDHHHLEFVITIIWND